MIIITNNNENVCMLKRCYEKTINGNQCCSNRKCVHGKKVYKKFFLYKRTMVFTESSMNMKCINIPIRSSEIVRWGNVPAINEERAYGERSERKKIWTPQRAQKVCLPQGEHH